MPSVVTEYSPVTLPDFTKREHPTVLKKEELNTKEKSQSKVEQADVICQTIHSTSTRTESCSFRVIASLE